MHHGTCVTHVPWCILGSLTRGGGENVPSIPGACATCNVAYLLGGPFNRVQTNGSEKLFILYSSYLTFADGWDSKHHTQRIYSWEYWRRRRACKMHFPRMESTKRCILVSIWINAFTFLMYVALGRRFHTGWRGSLGQAGVSLWIQEAFIPKDVAMLMQSTVVILSAHMLEAHHITTKSRLLSVYQINGSSLYKHGPHRQE